MLDKIRKYRRGLRIERQIWQDERQRFLNEFNPPAVRYDDMSDEELRNDFIRAVDRHRVNWSEYYHQYRFPLLSESQRSEFMTRSSMQKYYRHVVTPSIRNLLRDKELFLKAFAPLIHRKWFMVRTAQDLEAIDAHDPDKQWIAKPVYGTLGQGIFRAKTSELTSTLKDIISDKDPYLIEECLTNCPELAAFNASSLNTIRVVTIKKKGKSTVFGAFLRTGRKGAIVDNAHNGGLFAHIDIVKGEIDSDAINVDGDKFETHPDSGTRFKGFKIPYWERIKEHVTKAMDVVPEVKICGWDVSVTADHGIEIIEGNHAPDVDVMQSTINQGLKKEIKKTFPKPGMTEIML